MDDQIFELTRGSHRDRHGEGPGHRRVRSTPAPRAAGRAPAGGARPADPGADRERVLAAPGNGGAALRGSDAAPPGRRLRAGDRVAPAPTAAAVSRRALTAARHLG